jgi:hypothetical protein
MFSEMEIRDFTCTFVPENRDASGPWTRCNASAIPILEPSLQIEGASLIAGWATTAARR